MRVSHGSEPRAAAAAVQMQRTPSGHSSRTRHARAQWAGLDDVDAQLCSAQDGKGRERAELGRDRAGPLTLEQFPTVHIT